MNVAVAVKNISSIAGNLKEDKTQKMSVLTSIVSKIGISQNTITNIVYEKCANFVNF